MQNASLAGSDKNVTEEDDIWTVVKGKRYIYSQSKGLQSIRSSSTPHPQKTHYTVSPGLNCVIRGWTETFHIPKNFLFGFNIFRESFRRKLLQERRRVVLGGRLTRIPFLSRVGREQTSHQSIPLARR